LPDVTVPVIDLGAESIAAELRRACEEIGFFCVVGHRIDPALVAWVDEVSRAFFDLPLDEKLALRDGELAPDRPIYRPIRSESLGTTSGGERRGDLKESLDFGPTLPGVGWPERPCSSAPTAPSSPR
jgi:isopenicillin N synthase-like dioxygenase